MYSRYTGDGCGHTSYTGVGIAIHGHERIRACTGCLSMAAAPRTCMTTPTARPHPTLRAMANAALHVAIAAVCVEHGVDPALYGSITDALAEEPFLGSTLDVLDALSGVLVLDGEGTSGRLADDLLHATRNHGAKRPRHVLAASGPNSSSASSTLDQCLWKREYKSSEDRFERPYSHVLDERTLILEQAPFNPEGFASTVRIRRSHPRQRSLQHSPLPTTAAALHSNGSDRCHAYLPLHACVHIGVGLVHRACSLL